MQSIGRCNKYRNDSAEHWWWKTFANSTERYIGELAPIPNNKILWENIIGKLNRHLIFFVTICSEMHKVSLTHTATMLLVASK